MKQLIERLLAVSEPQKKYCVVVRPLGGGRYQVRDTQGRLFDVDAAANWQSGDGVTVSQGRIVKRAAKNITPKVYEV